MKFVCDVCGRKLSSQANLYRHTKNVHNFTIYDISKWRYKCLEESCNVPFKENAHLRKHLLQEHNIEMESETLEFSNKEEFFVWKNLIERQHKCSYRVLKSSKIKGNSSVSYYTCNRSGKAPSRSSCKKRLPKSQGSCKLNRNCTSMIKVVDDGNIFVTWIKTHYGHTLELQHIRLPKTEKLAMALKLKSGVTPSRLLDSYRDKISEDINREDLITRKDIQNIKKAYQINISEGVQHANNATSVDLWIKQCEQDDSNPVLFYKQQGMEDELYQLNKTDFCLIIMTDFQRSMLTKFGNNLIAIDETHCLYNCDFEVTTILVVDENGEGLPTAFMFTNRKDAYIFELFFTVIKVQVGVISPKTFMTDTVFTFYNAWSHIMGPVINQLFCSWNLDTEWKNKLSQIRLKNKRSEVYKLIKNLQQNTNSDKFCEVLENSILQMLSDVDTREFGIYFQNNYSSNYEKWAYCFREGWGINSSICLESMRKVIKCSCLGGKNVKRLDKSLHALLKYVRNKCVDRLIQNIKSNTIHIKKILARHKTAAGSSFSIKFDEENQTKWFITTDAPSEQNTYCVEKLLDQNCCDMICKECKICFHRYSCTCNDFCIVNTICKHIHCIAMLYKKKCNLKEVHEIDPEEINTVDTLREDTLALLTKLQKNIDIHKLNELNEEAVLQLQNLLLLADKISELPCTSQILK